MSDCPSVCLRISFPILPVILSDSPNSISSHLDHLIIRILPLCIPVSSGLASYHFVSPYLIYLVPSHLFPFHRISTHPISSRLNSSFPRHFIFSKQISETSFHSLQSSHSKTTSSHPPKFSPHQILVTTWSVAKSTYMV